MYRWQSSIASATSGLFEAMNAYKLSKISLNKLIHRPLDGGIAVKDESLNGALFKTYSNIREYEYIDNPATFGKFVNFLVRFSPNRFVIRDSPTNQLAGYNVITN